MILFGRKDKPIFTENLPKEECVKCNRRGGVVSVFQIYFHIALLPILPLSRKTASQCLQCRNIKTEKFFSKTELEVSDRLKKEIKTPYWTMIGAALILLFLIIKLILKWT